MGRGARIDTGETLAHLAATRGNVVGLRAALQMGADVEARVGGETAALLAAKSALWKTGRSESHFEGITQSILFSAHHGIIMLLQNYVRKLLCLIKEIKFYFWLFGRQCHHLQIILSCRVD